MMELEMFEATAEKMGISSKRFTKLIVVFFISIPVAVIVSSMYRNSRFSFTIFKGLSQNFTTNGAARVHNISVVLPDNIQNGTAAGERATTASGDIEDRGTARNVTAETLQLTGGPNITTHGFELGGTIQNITQHHSSGVSQNHSSPEGRTTENIIAADGGLKNASLASSTPEAEAEAVNLDEKLLGGLLASGFDEASCKSRMQSHLFRKASPHKPSPYLISKLRNYEQIHKRCGPRTRDYHRSMTNINGASSSSSSTMCKYILWTPANGLGNQMISITATFLYAILTDRVLLVKFNKDKHGLFCDPFLSSTWILPENSPFRSSNQHNTETYQTMLARDKATNSSKLPSALYINLQFSFENPEKFFHCHRSQDLLRNIPMLIMLSDQYYVPSMFMNPFFNLEIAKMFPERDTIFHHLGRYLFHPSNEAWQLISSYYKTHLAKADERIGLQVRVFSAANTPKQAIMNLVLSCVLQQKILPELTLSSSSSSAGKKNHSTVKAVLVASLYKEYGDNLRAMYMKKETVSGEVIEVYQPSHEGKQKFNDNRHNIKAWTEMYLLSLCDVLVTTSLSTFGYVAQGLGNLKPWLLNRIVGNHSGPFPRCQGDFSSEPCFHMPPKHYCNGEPINDIGSSFPFLRGCKDFRFGVKLAVNTTSMS